MVSLYRNAGGRLNELIVLEMRQRCGHLQPRKIVIKPNWVLHQTPATAPIGVLVTDPRVIEATVVACAQVFPAFEQIVVADCPLQSADWPLLCRQSGLSEVIERCANRFGERVQFMDLRRDVYTIGKGGVFIPDTHTPHGDPRGYREVCLNAESHLEEIAHQAERFSLVDHDDSVTRRHHRLGDHRYLVAQTFLDADLLINLPKWKTHSKAAITAAIKNLVGINGDKAYLPHYTRGSPRSGGDEYWDEDRLLSWLRVSVRQLVWRKSAIGIMLLRPCWRIVRYLYSQAARLNTRRARPPDLYVGGGGWYGNRTIWRMIYDLNMVIQRVDSEGKLRPGSQRGYFCIVDGLIAGEGAGPLNAAPRNLDCLAFGDDPFAIDTALSWFMGFDPDKIAILAERSRYMGLDWGRFEHEDLAVTVDGKATRLRDATLCYDFLPPAGWKDHVERVHNT